MKPIRKKNLTGGEGGVSQKKTRRKDRRVKGKPQRGVDW